MRNYINESVNRFCSFARVHIFAFYLEIMYLCGIIPQFVGTIYPAANTKGIIAYGYSIIARNPSIRPTQYACRSIASFLHRKGQPDHS